ncbi:MAG: ABC transporter substrate-binding protein, partial [Kiloniellales bacterium]|nr:ABC transporter substrate-binding protein [Kiloniellales bacterium]
LTTSYHYYQPIESAANTAFLDRWAKRFGADHPEIGTLAVGSYNAVHSWKKAVEAVGSLDREEIIAGLETGIGFDGPGGHMKVHKETHHAVMPIALAEVRDGAFKIIDERENVEPADTVAVCDLIANPNLSTQFQP